MAKGRIRAFGHTFITLDDVWNRSTNTFLEPDVPTLPLVDYPMPPSPVAVIDTGILSNHPLLSGKIAESIDITGENDPEDATGHGTIVSLILVKTSPNIRILNIKAMNKARESKEEWLAEGVRYAIQKRVIIIILCLGYDEDSCEEHPLLCKAVRDAVASGIIVVVAGEAKCPAEVEGVIAQKESATVRMAPMK